MMKVKSFLTEIKRTSQLLNLIINGGPFVTKKMGKFIDKMLVWCNLDLVANLLSFYHVVKNFRIVYNTKFENTIFVNINNDV